MKALHAFLYRRKLLWWWLPDSPFLWAAETYGLRTIQTVRMLHISGNSKWRYHRRVWAKQRDVTDIWLSQLMCDSGKTGWLQKCAVLKYSGCVLRSSRVLFGSLLQEDIFLHFFFFFFFGRRESGTTGKTECFHTQTPTSELTGCYVRVCSLSVGYVAWNGTQHVRFYAAS